MKQLISIGLVVTGAAVGLLSTLGDGWGLKLLMAGLGAFVGAVAGVSLSGHRHSDVPSRLTDETLRGLGTTDDDLLDNYWCDNGHPPFMRPPSPDGKQFGGADSETE
ncbi:MAG: hypothetical protein EKK46_04545 [Rhodocyclaceae bacterium]|nr:MAG: hypothetical protein EKK46_04545 [Rhodocyclaceae bacterium]